MTTQAENHLILIDAARAMHERHRQLLAASRESIAVEYEDLNDSLGQTLECVTAFEFPRSAKENGATVVCLLPARVDTRWWHDYCAKGEVFFVRGPLKFGGSENSAPFPNAVVVFRPSVHDALAEAV